MAKTKIKGEKKEKESVWIQCDNCGGGNKNHSILHQERVESDPQYPMAPTDYQIVRCLGCETIRFRTIDWDPVGQDHFGDFVYNEKIFPTPQEREWGDGLFKDKVPKAAPAAWRDKLPKATQEIYTETILAINTKARILAGAGLRAIVEALCVDQKVPGKNLEAKIEGLVARSLLTKPQAEILHVARYIGNNALHEIARPSNADLRQSLAIIESLLQSIYVYPDVIKELRGRHEKKRLPKPATKALPPRSTP